MDTNISGCCGSSLCSNSNSCWCKRIFSHSPITAYALESGYELSLSLEPNDDGEGYHYNLDLSDITKADVGKKISIEFTAAKYKNQTLNGAIGYSDPTDGYNWAQTKWEAKSDANGTYTLEFEITEGLVGHNAVQIQVHR